MDSRLTWNRCRPRRGDDKTWATFPSHNNLLFFILLLAFLIGFYALISWENVRCPNGVVITNSAQLSVPSKEKEQEQMPFMLNSTVISVLLVLLVAALVSVFHAFFKLNFFGLSSLSELRRPTDAKTGIYTANPLDKSVDCGKCKQTGKEETPSGSEVAICDGRLDSAVNEDDRESATSGTAEQHVGTGDMPDRAEDVLHVTPTQAQVDSGRPSSEDGDPKALSRDQEELPRRTVPVAEGDNHVTYDPQTERTADVCVTWSVDGSSQTDEVVKPLLTNAAMMTSSPELVDVAVNTHQNLLKIVRNCGTTTSGPFMKKLRRAQRLLKEAKLKSKLEKQAKIVKWRAIMERYKYKLFTLSANLEKKDRLLGYMTLNRALSENDVKDMCTAVRCHTSARDRLQTQIKLNSALRDVVESKCDSPRTCTPPPAGRPASQGASR